MEKLGLSGDTIAIDGNFIIKTCQTNQERFIKNTIKQEKFNNIYIKSVLIVERGIIDNKNYIKMPYLECDNSIIWLSKTNINNFYEFEYKLLNYLDNLFINSEIKEFNYDIWVNKIIDLEDKIVDETIKDILSIFKNLQFKQLFYYGDYHGDFTLSNLLVYNKEKSVNIEAIDFLESFIDSPINDIVKLRQDTKHLWTLNLLKEFDDINKNRVVIFLNHIDDKLNQLIKNNIILQEYYLPFQILNLIRIIPYNKDNKIFLYLKREIERLFYEFNINNAMCRKIC